MAAERKYTILLCLFHYQDEAEAASRDLLKAGIRLESILRLDNQGDAEATIAKLINAGVPKQEQEHLLEGLRGGGIVLLVEAAAEDVCRVELIFGEHRAARMDVPFADRAGSLSPAAIASAEARKINVVEQKIVVGTRTVDQGGLRDYRRVVEVPVGDLVLFRQDDGSVERNSPSRAATRQGGDLQETQTTELTETAEEVVLTKSTHVIEEVRVRKEVWERTEHIQDAVRRTEVELEEIAPVHGK